MTEHAKCINIDTGNSVYAVTLSANGKYLVSCHHDSVRVWDGRHSVATMEMHRSDVTCVAVSKDGRWIAAGTTDGEVVVWDANTYEQAFILKKDGTRSIQDVDFSPDSTRLVVASAVTRVWDLHTRKPTHILIHDQNWVHAAKYSPSGERIATATKDRVQVWGSNNGSLLVEFPVGVATRANTGLLWSNDHLFVVSDVIQELDASTGSTVSEWRVPNDEIHCAMALPKHGQFIAYAWKQTLFLWNTSTRSEITQVQHSKNIRSIAVLPDDRRIAIGGVDGQVVIHSLQHTFDSTPLFRLHPTLQQPIIQIEPTALDAWRKGQFDTAEALLNTVIADSLIPNHHALASRALIRTHLTRWDDALADAEKAIEFQSSVIGYIAKSIALVGKGDKREAYRSCDIAIERFHSDRVTFHLLVKSILVFMAGEHLDAISRIDDLIAIYPFISIFYVVQVRMLILHGNTLMECCNYEDAIRSFQRARAQLRFYPPESLCFISLVFGWKFDNLHLTIRQRMCEALYSAGRTETAGKSLLELVRISEKEMCMTENVVKWVSDFTRRFLSTPGSDTVSNSADNSNISMLHTSLSREWVKMTLTRVPWKDAFAAAAGFVIQRFVAYRAICEHLETTEHIVDASQCILKMANEMTRESAAQAEGIMDFKRWLSDKLEKYGDVAMNARRSEEAIILYSAALSLDHSPLQSLFAKRSRARANMGLWKDALDDAIQVTILQPTLPMGYERKFAALRGAGCYAAADVAFATMLLKMSESLDAQTRERACQYVKPAETEDAIREAVEEAIRRSPPVLINTYSGRLLDHDGQALSFESLPIFHELVSSTTIEIDRARIQDEVRHYYRYATFSHKWRKNEPSYDDIIHLIVYELEESPTHENLQKFCKTVRDAGLHWAWSDTCCIKKSDPSVLQEALVSMFQWYQSSALTVVLLCDVPLHRLFDSVWNSRAWTFQEYHASKVVRFFNKDWTLYRNLDIPNHKKSPEIIAEMEEATGISAQALANLRPGLEDIRKKLQLASTRQSTRVEDAAYSLLGIFSLSMSIEYGEGDRALGRLLSQLLTSSGDTSILAWTGESGGFNSCLPEKIAVFSQSATSHIPAAVTGADMENAITTLGKASLNRALLTELYDRLNALPVPHVSGKRMKLPSIIFKLGPLSVSRRGSERVFRAQTCAVGIVEIKTDEDLSRFHSLVLVHPWIDFLLDRQPVGSIVGTLPEGQPLGVIETTQKGSAIGQSLSGEPLSSPDLSLSSARTKTGTYRRFHRLGLFGRWSALSLTGRLGTDTQSLRPPSTVSDMDRQTNAFRVLARLKQPFGALLLAPDPGNVNAYKRVAAGTVITVRVEETTPATLARLIRSVDVLDVL